MYAVGIDLGTTNTVLAAEAAVVALDGGRMPDAILPSVVAYRPDGSVSVGEAARLRRAIDARNTVYSSKRLIGEPFRSARLREQTMPYPVQLVPARDGQVGFNTRAGVVTPTQVATEIVSALCRAAALDASKHDAVVSVPAGFSAAQRAATIRATRGAGFARVRCIPEPVATALAYMNRSDARTAIVYDLGGGTFDLAVLDCSRDPVRIIAHGGETYLGGDDIDHALAGFVADCVLQRDGWDLRSDPQVFTRLSLEVERAKVRLSSLTATTFDLQQVDSAAPASLAEVPLDRNNVRELSAAILQRTFLVCDQVLGSAGIAARDVEAVFLAGGCTLAPDVRAAVASYFGNKLRHELNPMHVVSIGASIAAIRPRFANLLQEA